MQNLIRSGARIVLALSLSIFAVCSQAQSNRLEFEFSKKVEAAQKIEALSAGSFGEVVDDSTGRTMFKAVDIDLPGNSLLPVRFGRVLPIDERHLDQELGGVGNWDVDVPYIEGTFSKLYGWAVVGASPSDRLKRCSRPDYPAIQGVSFSANEVFHGYRVHLPDGSDGPMVIDTTAYADPTDGKAYPWIMKGFARISCLSTLKNGAAGEGFVLLTTSGVSYFFDVMIERKAPTLRKAPKGCEGVEPYCTSMSIARKRVFLLASKIM